MNIKDLTIGQAEELVSLFGNNNRESCLHDRYVGKYVICRTRSEGVNAGEVIALDDTGVVLRDARRLYYHLPADKKMSWYEGVAKSGLAASSKVGVAIDKFLSEDYSLTVCTEDAERSIRSAKNHEQS